MKGRNKGIVLSYIRIVLNAIITLFLSSYIIRKVGSADYGVYQTMNSFVSYLVLLEFGTGTMMTRNISLCHQKDGKSQEIRESASTIGLLTIGCIGLILLVGICFWFGIDTIYVKTLSAEQIVFGKKIFVLAIVRLVFSFLKQTLDGILLGYEKYSLRIYLSIADLIMRAILIYICLFVSTDVLLVPLVDAVLSILFFGFSLFYCIRKLNIKFSYRYFNKDILIQAAPTALAMFLQGIINSANGNVDKFIISIKLAPSYVTVYSIAMAIYTMFSSVGCTLMSLYMPQIARDMSAGLKGKELTKTLIQPCRLNILIMGTIMGGFFVIGKEFIYIIYGKEYEQAWICAMVVIVGTFFNLSNAVVINVIDIMLKRHIRSLIMMITTALNIILTIIGIAYIGIFGAALATAISMIIQTIMLNIFYQKKLDIFSAYLLKKSFKGILEYIILACLVSVILKGFVPDVWTRFIVGGISFCIIFFGCYMLFGANERERNIIKKFLKIY